MDDPEGVFDLCEQRKAFLDHDSHALVKGGPGSGKTTIGLLKARRLVLDDLPQSQSILLLSFSNAATRRVLETAEDLLTKQISRQVTIKTYHAFAWEILRSHGYLNSNRRQLRILPSQYAAVRRAGLSDETWIGEQERLYVEEGMVTYDQFARKAADILEGSKKARTVFSNAHPTILVDEFQDTDADQWRLVKALGNQSNIVALGDTGQRIYAWRPGVDPKRLDEFVDHFDATRFDFANENNRSPASEIASYARALLNPAIKLPEIEDIKFAQFGRGKPQFIAAAKLSVLTALQEARKRAGSKNVSIAVAARSNPLVRVISDALSTPSKLKGREVKSIQHDILIDQTEIMLAARVVAYLMGSVKNDQQFCIAGCLDRIADAFRASGNKTNIERSDTLMRWAEKCREGKPPSTKCVKALQVVIESVLDEGLCGAPTRDWLTVRRAMERADAPEVTRIAEHSRFLRLLRRGSLIEETLTDLWRRSGNYAGADEALEQAIVNEQLTDPYRENASINVMNMHQLKGREYDAVVLIEDEHRTFCGQDKKPPYMETRRLLQVSLTRARHFAVVISSDRSPTFAKLSSD